jgi:hypothetical protein
VLTAEWKKLQVQNIIRWLANLNSMNWNQTMNNSDKNEGINAKLKIETKLNILQNSLVKCGG